MRKTLVLGLCSLQIDVIDVHMSRLCQDTYTKVIFDLVVVSDSKEYRPFRAQRFYIDLLPVLGFLHRSTDLDELYTTVKLVFIDFD